MFRLLALVAVIWPGTVVAGVLDVTRITDNVYAIVGPFDQRNPENLGNNATFGLIVTDGGAVLIDAGGSYKGAEALHNVIETITDEPVAYVINTGGQDHRWIGNSYWQEQGARVIASEAAVADQQARASIQQTVLNALIKDKLEGTTPSHADITFTDSHTLSLGGTLLEITHAGPAHTPGDSFVWHAESGVMFTGDITYVGRILGVMEFSSTIDWVATFEAMAAHAPKHLVPGHGPVTDLKTAQKDTYDYLVNLRTQMAAHIEDGGDIIGAVNVDQAAFSYLANFDQLARRNAQEAFSQMEWE